MARMTEEQRAHAAAENASIRDFVKRSFPGAYKRTDAKQMKTHIVVPPALPGVTSETIIGVGYNGDAAWRDAYDSFLRPPVPIVAHGGSPTWSLRDDEEFWKAPPPATDV